MIWKKKICSKSFSDASNSSDFEEEIIKEMSTLKPFDMESRKAVPRKHVLEERIVKKKSA